MNIGVSLQRNFTIENCVGESKFQTSVKGELMLWWITPSTNNNALTHSHGNKCQLEKCHCSIDTDLSTHQLPPLCHPSLLRKYSSIKLLSLGKLPTKEMTKTGSVCWIHLLMFWYLDPTFQWHFHKLCDKQHVHCTAACSWV